MGSISSNRYYNDPAIGQAFSNIAQMFAPPSGSDLAGYATARAKGLQADALKNALSVYNNPNATQDEIDRASALAQLYPPTQGFGARNMDDATKRYGYDSVAATSRANNSADNARSLEETKLKEAGELARLYAAPITASENATVFLPNQTQKATGLPGVLSGNISVAQGERVVMPDGRTFAGAMKPMTDAEMKGAIMGTLSPQDQREIAMSGVNVEQVLDANGRPVFASRQSAVGQQPAPPVSSAAPETQNYQTPEGKRGTAVFDPTSKSWIDTASGQFIPQGSITFNSSLQGGAADTGLGPTTANNTAANSQDAAITQALNTVDVYEELVRNNPGTLGLVGLIRGTAQNTIAAANDLASSFGKTRPELEEAAREIRNGLAAVAPGAFDASIPEAKFLQSTLAYAIARTENPSGEVSRQAYDRALERISGGLLGNSQETLSNIGAYRKVLQQQLTGVNALRDPNGARRDTSFSGNRTIPTPPSPPEPPRPPQADDVEEWMIGPNGKPVRVR